ncbi:MAG: Holliday junction branch migration protein RuvA [Gammaproteobacteria bacterium]|nr:Holliday junction branch migration protein RuvA [Gammaproteobacteria bacterium]
MIGRLEGKIVDMEGTFAVIDVNGVGYEVEVPLGTFDEYSVGDDCTLHTHQVIQQDVQALYAFPNKPMREFFRVLIKISGIGPKSAVSMLGVLSVGELVRCVSQRDASALMKVKGVGKRTAERIVVDLSDRVERLPYALAQSQVSSTSLQSDAETALVQLGFGRSLARQAIDSAWYDGIELEELIRSSLQRLSR